MISASVTTCVKFTDFVSPGANVSIVAVFSSELSSFTTTLFNVILPIFFTSTSYSIISLRSYFPSLSLSVLVTFFVTCTPSVSTISGSVGISDSPIKATFLIAPLTLVIVTSNVTVASELAFTWTLTPCISSSAVTFLVPLASWTITLPFISATLLKISFKSASFTRVSPETFPVLRTVIA